MRRLAAALGRPYETVRTKAKKLERGGWKTKATPSLTARDRLKMLDERFKHPLLRVAITPGGLPPDWTPIDRLDDLELYSGVYWVRKEVVL